MGGMNHNHHNNGPGPHAHGHGPSPGAGGPHPHPPFQQRGGGGRFFDGPIRGGGRGFYRDNRPQLLVGIRATIKIIIGRADQDLDQGRVLFRVQTPCQDP